MNWKDIITDTSKQWEKFTDTMSKATDFCEKESKDVWDFIVKGSKISWDQSLNFTTTMAQQGKTFLQNNTEVISNIRDWISNLFVKSIQSCASEQDRLEMIRWLALVREILENQSLSTTAKAKNIYRLIDSKKTIQIIFNSVVESVKNYKNSDLPMSVKVAVPATLAAAAFVGGQGAGLAAFGGAIGVPVLLLIFLGSAGITSIIEAFFTKSESRDYISLIIAMISRDECLRRISKAMQEIMVKKPIAPLYFDMPDEEKILREKLIKMDPYDFERHVMSFFQLNGNFAWVTKKSNDFGVDGFAYHNGGVIVVQCKRHSPDNPVGRPVVQQFKGVIEENGAWRGYIVTTSYFTTTAIQSAAMNDRIMLVDMDCLVDWHVKGFSLTI
ncbi:restriction system protein [Candidatus Magnetomoraceae bacterium gMMP-15]